jgi:hypothetical protein
VASSISSVPASRGGPTAVARATFLEQTGAEVVRVAVTGAGGMLDLRFRVIDPDAAAIIHDPARTPALVDERTGRVIDALFMGHSHRGSYKAGLTYYLVFLNPQRLVEPGDEVTVRLGGKRLAHVVVE